MVLGKNVSAEARRIREKKGREHEKLVQRACEDPGIIIIDGKPIDSGTVISKSTDFEFGGYFPDIAFLRDIEKRTAGVDFVDMKCTCYGKSILRGYDRMRRSASKFNKDPGSLLIKLEEEFGPIIYSFCRLSLDMILTYYGFSGAIESQRLPGYKKRDIAVYRY